MSTITIPEGALVILMGPAGCGKSTFANAHFPVGVVSSDKCREYVCDDATSQDNNKQAFELFHAWIKARLAAKKTTVADATNLSSKAREAVRQLGSKAPVILLYFDVTLARCLEQNAARARKVPEDVIVRHFNQHQQAQSIVTGEGFTAVYRIDPDEKYTIVQQGGVRVMEAPGFDIVGDVHGCLAELTTLIFAMGYTRVNGAISHPQGRKLVFVGDFTDRGPDSVGVLRLIRQLLTAGHGAVMGNHDSKLFRALKGNKVQPSHGLAETLAQLDAECSDAEKVAFRDLLGSLPYQLRLQSPGSEEVIVTHAGIPIGMIGQDSSFARNHALFGEVIAVSPEGSPTRGQDYMRGWKVIDGAPLLVHGHTVVPSPYPLLFVNVVNVDQGCVFGGQLTALQWPEGETTSVRAQATYSMHTPPTPADPSWNTV